MKINPYLQNVKKIDWDIRSVKLDQTTQNSSEQISTSLSAMGVSNESDMQSAYRILKRAGIEPNKGVMTETQRFLEGSKGTSEDKLFSIQTAAAKGIEITEKNLGAVHAALNGEGNEAMAIEGLLKTEFDEAEPLSDEQIEKIVEKLPRELKEKVYAELEKLGIPEGVAKELGNRLLAEGSPAKLLAMVIRGSDKVLSPELMKALQAKVEKLGVGSVLEKLMVVNLKITLHLDIQGLETVGVKLEDIEQWLKSLSEDELKNKLMQLLERLNETEPLDRSEPTYLDSDKTENIKLQDESVEPESFIDPEDFLNHLEQMVEQALQAVAGTYGNADLEAMISSKSTRMFKVTEITVHMTAVKATYDHFKKDALAELDKTVNQPSTQLMADTAAKVAEKLDNLIMKSDLTLYTDMKTERKLLGLSSDLQQVVKLAKEDPNAALALLKETKKRLDGILFQPVKERIQLVAKDQISELAGGSDLLGKYVPRASQGPRQLMDLMRAMGLNHEPELMEAVFSTEGKLRPEEKQQNFKQMLLQLSSEESETNQQLVKSIEKGLNNLTGQQLLNRPELQNDTQSLFFNLPLAHGGADHPMRLYIKARKNSQSLDWENCSMYLLMDLKAYGETGIRIQIKQRQLSVAVSNKSESIMQAIEPFAKELMGELKDVGYNPGDIRFVPFDDGSAKPAELPKISSVESKGEGMARRSQDEGKGFELKI